MTSTRGVARDPAAIDAAADDRKIKHRPLSISSGRPRKHEPLHTT